METRTSHTYDLDALRTLAQRNPQAAEFLADHNRTGGLTVAQIYTFTAWPGTVEIEQPVQQRTPVQSGIERAFAHAVSKGTKQPIVRIAGFQFMLAGERARPDNRGAIFVTRGERNELYLGKVRDGKFFPSNACTDQLTGSVMDAMAEPYKAATAYGFATGQCSICARPLSNPESLKYGIGPVCRAKFGW